MRIVIPGGSGHLGQLLASDFSRRGDDVVVLSRAGGGRNGRPWEIAPWSREVFDGADVVINLAGRSVVCRYTARNRREIMNSRVLTTAEVGEAIAQAKHPPKVWLQASTATIYSHRYDAANTESKGLIGEQEAKWRFSIDVATAWERTFDGMAAPYTRKVKMRAAVVMSRHHGTAFAILRRLALLGAGGSTSRGSTTAISCGRCGG